MGHTVIMSDSDINHLLRALQELTVTTNAMRAEVTDLKVQVGKLQTEMALRPTCPHPGKCGDLEEDFKEMRDEHSAAIQAISKDIAEHKLLIAEARGAWKLAGGACAVIMAAFEALKWWLSR